MAPDVLVVGAGTAGLTVLRFANAQVLREPEAVVEAILDVCSRGPHP